jgi:hypothetical protein
MSKVKTCLINNVYSFSNLKSTNTKITGKCQAEPNRTEIIIIFAL